MKMNDKTEVQELISYLQTLVEVSKSTEIRVFAEMKRTIARLETLLNKQ
jgi:ribosomal protein L29